MSFRCILDQQRSGAYLGAERIYPSDLARRYLRYGEDSSQADAVDPFEWIHAAPRNCLVRSA